MGTPENGGARRDRTVDLLHAMQALSQLSYGPVSEGADSPEEAAKCQIPPYWAVMLLSAVASLR